MKKCKLVQNIMNFKFCYIIFCTIICFIVLSVPTFAKENSDNVIRVGSFEETYNVVNEKGERSGYGYEYLQDIAGYAPCGFFSYRRLDKGFFATFFVRHHAH